jgi:hypothetical protein
VGGLIMKFTFDYKEILARRVIIEADTMADAIQEIERRINAEEIVLDSEDFVSGEITMPLNENLLPRLRDCGENVEDKDDLDIVVDFW